jgi:hypothetical protein
MRTSRRVDSTRGPVPRVEQPQPEADREGGEPARAVHPRHAPGGGGGERGGETADAHGGPGRAHGPGRPGRERPDRRGDEHGQAQRHGGAGLGGQPEGPRGSDGGQRDGLAGERGHGPVPSARQRDAAHGGPGGQAEPPVAAAPDRGEFHGLERERRGEDHAEPDVARDRGPAGRPRRSTHTGQANDHPRAPNRPKVRVQRGEPADRPMSR